MPLIASADRTCPAAVRTSRRRSRTLGRGLLGVTLILLLGSLPYPGATAGRLDAQAASSRDQASLTGLLVTSAATAEDIDPSITSAPTGGLVLQITLDNQTGQDLAGLQVQAPVPTHTRVTESYLARAGQSAGSIAGQTVSWGNLAITSGQTLGPFVYRVTPEQGAEGGLIFQNASVTSVVSWMGPAMGTATPPTLRLAGLWGEGGLRRTVLPSGLTILTRERPDTPTIAFRVGVRAGSRDETETNCGGSHWLEHAHFLGTERRPSNQAIFGAISSVGGQMNASTGWENTDYFDLVPGDQFDLALDVLADQMLHSTFSPDAFNRERQVVHQEHSLRNDNTSVHAFDLFINTVFRVSPLRQNPGNVVCLDRLPLDAILAYRAQHYVTADIAIAVSGDLHHDDAVEKIAHAFADLPRGSLYPRARAPEPVETDVRRIEEGDGTRTAEVRLGWPAPGDDSPDFATLAILNDILGTTGRRLQADIRDRLALATQVSPTYLDFSDAGALMLSATTTPDRVDQVVDRLLAQVQRLRDGDVSDADVQASVQAIAGRRSLANEPNLGQTLRANDEVIGPSFSYEEYVTLLRSVTATDVTRAAQTHLDPLNYTLIIVRR
jgi:predicted Zn-dependent peptidase